LNNPTECSNLSINLDQEVGQVSYASPARGNKMSSAFVSRAMPAAIPADGLVISIGENPKPASSPPLHVHFDVCPTWLELAIRHLSDAQVAQVARVAAWKGADENSKAGALEWEFEASMQSIMASAIAVDAFCAVVQTKVQPPQSLIDQWREKRMPRHSQITEVLRNAFSLTVKEASTLRQNLGEIYRFRDLAVDPSARSDAPILHPELRVGVEWRFAYFRCENALLIVRATSRLIWELVASGKPKDADVQKYIDALRPRIERLQNSNGLKAQAAATDAHRSHEA
jgi:hypothetical protein